MDRGETKRGALTPGDSGSDPGGRDGASLFDEPESGRTRRAASRGGPAAPTKALLSYFDSQHEARFKTKAHIVGAKDAKLIADLWKNRKDSRITVELLIDEFFKSKDPFIERRGFTVPVFIGQVGALLIRLSRQQRILDEDAYDWKAECLKMHGGRCRNSYTHSLFKT